MDSSQTNTAEASKPEETATPSTQPADAAKKDGDRTKTGLRGAALQAGTRAATKTITTAEEVFDTLLDCSGKKTMECIRKIAASYDLMFADLEKNYSSNVWLMSQVREFKAKFSPCHAKAHGLVCQIELSAHALHMEKVPSLQAALEDDEIDEAKATVQEIIKNFSKTLVKFCEMKTEYDAIHKQASEIVASGETNATNCEMTGKMGTGVSLGAGLMGIAATITGGGLLVGALCFSGPAGWILLGVGAGVGVVGGGGMLAIQVAGLTVTVGADVLKNCAENITKEINNMKMYVDKHALELEEMQMTLNHLVDDPATSLDNLLARWNSSRVQKSKAEQKLQMLSTTGQSLEDQCKVYKATDQRMQTAMAKPQ